MVFLIILTVAALTFSAIGLLGLLELLDEHEND